MKIEMDKVIVKQTMKEEAITEWVKPKGFALSCVCIHIPVFKISLNVAYGPFDVFSKFIKKQFEQDVQHSNANALAMTFEYEKTQWNWINITSCEWTAQDYGTICHELHHFAHFALGNMGIKYGEGGEECFAYFQGYSMELVVRAFSMLHKKTRAKDWNKGQKKL